MMIGVSSSGTGGGLKIATFITIYAAISAGLRGNHDITFQRQRIAQSRLLMAFAILGFYLMLLLSGSFGLLLIETHRFEEVVFEAASALGTVGLSRDISFDLTPLGKIIIILLMFMGRVGPLAFAAVLFAQPAAGSQKKQSDIAI
jgi:trk system potassium uptake protein TrkH